VGHLWWPAALDGQRADDGVEPGVVDTTTEIWLDGKWGVRGSRYETGLDELGFDSTSHTSIDLRRRFFALTERSFVALGAGWESIDLDDGVSSSGVKLTAEGRLGLGDSVSLYGQTSWLPGLEDVGTRSNLQGQGVEAGLTFDPAPSMSVRLGYRRFRLDFDDLGGNGSAESDGFILGAGFHW
jgi:opacity protein-like surface antigen